MKKKLLRILIIVVAFIILLVGYTAWYSRNTAKSEAKSVLKNFATITSSQWYCENGYGKGIDNQIPWWEEIYLSDVQPEKTAKKIEDDLKTKGYSFKSQYIENSQEQTSNNKKSYWKIEGTRNNYSVEARVSSKELTLDNCFKGFSNMNETLKPEEYNSVIIIYFQDNS